MMLNTGGVIMDHRTYDNVLSGVIEETQSCKKRKKKSGLGSIVILLLILLVTCLIWILLA